MRKPKGIIVCAALLLGSPLGVDASYWERTPRFAFNPSWFGQLSSFWNTVTDYEASHWEMGVSDYTFNSTSTYRGVTSSINKHMWLSSNGNENYVTTYNYGDGTSETDTTAFYFGNEKRDYTCSTTDGVDSTHLVTNTKFWIHHFVDRWPTSSANLSPGSGSASIDWIYNTLTSGCSGSTEDGLETLTSCPYSKSQKTLNATSVPINNTEVTLYEAGKQVNN